MRQPRALAASTRHGALGGRVASGCLSVLRMDPHRSGLIDETGSPAAPEWLAERPGSGEAMGHPGPAVAQLGHLVRSAGCGAVHGPALARRGARKPLWSRASSGTGPWALGALGVFLEPGIAPPAWRTGAIPDLVNMGAHLLLGAAARLVAGEPGAPGRPAPDVRSRSAVARVA